MDRIIQSRPISRSRRQTQIFTTGCILQKNILNDSMLRAKQKHDGQVPALAYATSIAARRMTLAASTIVVLIWYACSLRAIADDTVVRSAQIDPAAVERTREEASRSDDSEEESGSDEASGMQDGVRFQVPRRLRNGSDEGSSDVDPDEVQGAGSPPSRARRRETVSGDSDAGARRRRGSAPRGGGAFGATARGAGTPTVSTTPDDVDTSSPTDIDLEVWIEWGGGREQHWNGSVNLDQGKLVSVAHYGLAADCSGSITHDGRQVTIAPPSSRLFDSFKLRFQSPADANLQLEFVAADGDGPATHTIPVAELITQVHNKPLDAFGNRVIVRRTAGDALRVKTDRRSFVFHSRDRLEFFVEPNLPGVDESTYSCTVQLEKARGDKIYWNGQQEASRGADGEFSPVGPFKPKLPSEEGVYDIVIWLSKLRSQEREYERRIQVVVIEDAPLSQQYKRSKKTEVSTPKIVQAFNPGNREHMSRVSASTSELRPIEKLGKSMLELPAGARLSIPLTIEIPDKPYLVEIDYPNDSQQKLSFTIAESDVTGRVTNKLADTGLSSPFVAPDTRAEISTVRFTIWPSTPNPQLMVANRGGSSALCGEIRISTSPGFPEAPTSTVGRLVATYLDEPFLTEAVGASQRLDARSNRTLKDWVTFHEAAKRLVRQLKGTGYNAAVIPVVADGGALYPSELVGSNARYDNGMFFATAQDPLGKDVLELLFRMFDREGLALIPALRLTGTMPNLEQQQRNGRDGILLADADGTTWRDKHGRRQRSGAHYNILNDRVQQTVRGICQEVIARARNHTSFRGIAVQLSPDSYAMLPGAQWGADESTIQHFFSEAQLTGEESEEEMRHLWLVWRSRRLANLYRMIRNDLAAAAPEARLYLAPSGLQLTRRAERLFRSEILPVEITPTDLLFEHGIDAELYHGTDIVLLRPRHSMPSADGLLNFELAWGDELDKIFKLGQADATGSMLFVEPQGLQTVNNAAGLELVTPLIPANIHNRRRFVHAIASIDSSTIFDGSLMGILAHEDPLIEFLKAYSALPRQRFQSVPARSGSGQPVVLRTHRDSTGTYFYLANDSPWRAAVHIEFSTASGFTLRPLGSRQLPTPTTQGQGASWSVELEPFDFVAAVIPDDARIMQWSRTVPEEVQASLRAGINVLESRVDSRHRYPLLRNAGFEDATEQLATPGWSYGNGTGIHVFLEPRHVHSGKYSLHLRSVRPAGWSYGPTVWLRSDAFEPPKTGRLMVSMWLRVYHQTRPPNVRILVEGKLDGKPWQRIANLGSHGDEGAPALRAQWSEFTIPIDRLPKGVKDLRVGVDLRGEGDVWIDNVQLHDIWLTSDEQARLRETLSKANDHFDGDRLKDCVHLLNGRQQQFLLRHFPITEADLVPAEHSDSDRGIATASARRDLPPGDRSGGDATRLGEGFHEHSLGWDSRAQQANRARAAFDEPLPNNGFRSMAIERTPAVADSPGFSNRSLRWGAGGVQPGRSTLPPDATATPPLRISRLPQVARPKPVEAIQHAPTVQVAQPDTTTPKPTATPVRQDPSQAVNERPAPNVDRPRTPPTASRPPAASRPRRTVESEQPEPRKPWYSRFFAGRPENDRRRASRVDVPNEPTETPAPTESAETVTPPVESTSEAEPDRQERRSPSWFERIRQAYRNTPERTDNPRRVRGRLFSNDDE